MARYALVVSALFAAVLAQNQRDSTEPPAHGTAGVQDVVREQHGPAFTSREIRLEPTRFSIAEVEEICKATLADPGRPRFLQVRITSSAPFPSKPDHFNYTWWRRWYDEFSLISDPTAEMIAVGGDVAVRYRGSSGEISRQVLSGTDPFTVEVTGESLEVVEIALVNVPLRRGPTKTHANIFLTTRAELTSEFGSRVFEALASRIPVPIASLEIRHDDWFIDNMWFPIVHPFAVSGKPPSAQQYAASPTLHCVERVKCTISQAP